MRKKILILIIITQSACTEIAMDRVEKAYAEKQEKMTQLLREKGINIEALELFLRAFKQEQILEVWGKNKQDTVFTKLIEYPFCKFSGKLGPKRKEGDKQIPEGIYHIDRFNAKSNFHLSLGLNYPNKSDRILGDPERPGSDIFIHGGCQTIGCIPITNDKIRELYLLANEVKKHSQSAIRVHIFPTKMTSTNLARLYQKWPQHQVFWKNLSPLYDAFEEKRRLSNFRINPSGQYLLQE